MAEEIADGKSARGQTSSAGKSEAGREEDKCGPCVMGSSPTRLSEVGCRHTPRRWSGSLVESRIGGKLGAKGSDELTREGDHAVGISDSPLPYVSPK